MLILFIHRNLQKARLKKMNSLVVRDSLRNERAKAMAIEAELNEKREQLKMQIGKLNMLNNQAEEGMVQLRKKYETAVQHRNDRYKTSVKVCDYRREKKRWKN